jgi:release factor glutamine methyltransferase
MQGERTIREAYLWASSFLQHHDISSYEFEAEWMLRRLLDVDRARFFMIWNEPLVHEAQLRLREWLKRRSQGEPLQYIFGDQEFYGRLFQVNPSVLIPRPETELLVEKVMQEAEMIWGDQPIHVVDVGTGSGAIAVTLACEKPNWSVTAIDISAEALQVARTNARLHGVEEKIRWIHGEYLNPLLEEKAPIQILVSNPPYIPTDVIPTLEKQVALYEPHLALDGGVDGLTPYRVLTWQFAQWSHTPRLACFEIGTEQGEAVANLVKAMADDVDVSVDLDWSGHQRIVIGRVKK